MRRPFDLRHACLSTWLNAGVPATQVAEWAGHSVDLLLRIYAKCLDGTQDVERRRIEDALRFSGSVRSDAVSEAPEKSAEGCSDNADDDEGDSSER